MARKPRAMAQTVAMEVIVSEETGIRIPVAADGAAAQEARENGVTVESAGVLETVIAATQATPAPSAEDKAAAVLKAAAEDKTLAEAEKAASRLNKPNKKVLADWLVVGAAMNRIDELVNGNKKLIGKIVETLPEFAMIPSPIRSNAKWLFLNRTTVEPLIGVSIKGDHPTTIREKFKLLQEQAAANATGEDEPEDEGEGEGGSNEDSEGEAVAVAALQAFVDNASREALANVLTKLGSLMAAKPATRKMLMAQLPK